MHPTIKIICLLVMSAMLVSADPIRLVLVTSVLLIAFLTVGRSYWLDVGKMVWRLKWFWLSIIFLYGWIIPGNSIFEGGFFPSTEGIQIGLGRIAVLLDIILAVILLLKTTAREQLIMATAQIIKPLELLNVNSRIFAYRLVLTLEYASNVDKRMKTRIDALEPGRNLLQNGIDILAEQIAMLEKSQATTEPQVLELQVLMHAQWWQWLYPLSLFLILAFIQ